MPRTIVECVHCRTSYDSTKEAEDCEKGHAPFFKLTKANRSKRHATDEGTCQQMVFTHPDLGDLLINADQLKKVIDDGHISAKGRYM